LNEIREHGVRDYPYECCGCCSDVTRGRQESSRDVSDFECARGECEAQSFSDYAGRVDAGERYAASRDLEVVGFYHSHPDSPAVPSNYDLEHAWPTYSYIIVSTSAGQATDLFSWEQQEDRSRFNQEEIKCQ
jgi:proteasome lid subunit RPN8/RPN11